MWNQVLEKRSARSILGSLSKEQAAAVIELLYIIVALDGEFSEAEMDEARAQLEQLTFDWASDEREVRAVVAHAWQHGTSFEDREAIRLHLQTLADQVPAGEAREVVFLMAAFVSAADGIVPAESEVLSELRQALGMSEARYTDILERVKE